MVGVRYRFAMSHTHKRFIVLDDGLLSPCRGTRLTSEIQHPTPLEFTCRTRKAIRAHVAVASNVTLPNAG